MDGGNPRQREEVYFNETKKMKVGRTLGRNQTQDVREQSDIVEDYNNCNYGDTIGKFPSFPLLLHHPTPPQK